MLNIDDIEGIDIDDILNDAEEEHKNKKKSKLRRVVDRPSSSSSDGSVIIEGRNTFNNIQPALICTEYPTVKLKDHQKSVCKYILSHPNQKGLILFHSVGSGKTITSITILNCILMNLKKNKSTKIFVVTPKSLQANYLKEINKLGVNLGAQFYLMTHQRFVNEIKNKGAQFAKDSVIVVDEGHNFKNPIMDYADNADQKITKKRESNRTRQLMKASKVASKIYFLTATPIQNKPSEISAMYSMVTGQEDNINGVMAVLKMYESYLQGIIPIEKRDLVDDNKKLVERMFKNQISYFKNNDTSEYPKKTEEVVLLRMSPQYYNAYKQLEEGLNPDVPQNFLAGMRKGSNKIDIEQGTPKVSWAVDKIAESVKKNQKVLLYSNYLDSGINIIRKDLDDLNIPYVVIDGSLSAKQRDINVKKYNGTEAKKYEDNAVSVMLITSAGTEGLDLKNTRNVIILEQHWNREKIEQIMGRAVRYHSHQFLDPKDRNVTVYHLLLLKPNEKFDEKTTKFVPNLISVDSYLYYKSLQKNNMINKFYSDVLIKQSIENEENLLNSDDSSFKIPVPDLRNKRKPTKKERLEQNHLKI